MARRRPMQVVVGAGVWVGEVCVLSVAAAHVGAGVVEDLDGEGVEGAEGVVDEVGKSMVWRCGPMPLRPKRLEYLASISGGR